MPDFVMRWQQQDGSWCRAEIAGCVTRKEADKHANAFFNANDFRELRLHRRLRYDRDDGEEIGRWVVLGEGEGERDV